MAFVVQAPIAGNSQHGTKTTTTTTTATITRSSFSGMNSQNWGNASTASQLTSVDEETVDAYAMKVLEDASPLDVSVDAEYLAPYITGVLRAEQACASQLENLPDYDNVLELLQEHCSMAREDAKETLQKIAQAVMKGMVPVEFYYNYSDPNSSSSAAAAAAHVMVSSPTLGPFGSPPSSMNSMSLSALQLLESVNVEAAAQEAEAPTAAACSLSNEFNSLQVTTNSAATTTGSMEGAINSVISPVQPDNLIPGDLLGAIDYEDDADAAAVAVAESNDSAEEATSQDPLEDEFPSLSVAAASKLSRKASRSRSRQGSIDDSSLSENSSRKVSPHLQPQMPPPMQAQTSLLQQQRQQYPYSHSLDSSAVSDPATMLQMTCDMLIGMNPDMGQDAIFQAATMANSNVGVAQYLMDCAMTAPPICRHLLNAGCYRSDCQFSHDLDGHTCVFWLRGRCTKGSSCQFLHGYNHKWLTQLEEQQQQQQQQYHDDTDMGQLYMSNTHQDYCYNGTSYGNEQPDTHQLDGTAKPSAATAPPNSFANIASQGYNDRTCFQQQTSRLSASTDSASGDFYDETKLSPGSIPTIKIPQDVWNPHERRDASAFHIADPIERYREVSRHHSLQTTATNNNGRQGHNSHQTARTDVIDLHFQSTKTFAVVLEHVLPEKLTTEPQGVWIVTGTGHHVGTKTHQKGGGILESAVMVWLTEHDYDFWKGKDRNGHGGALFVKKSVGIGVVQ